MKAADDFATGYAPEFSLDPHFQSDTGYADAFAKRFCDRVRFIPEEGRWLLFDASRGWHRDTSSEVESMFADYARELYRDACQKAAGLDPSQGAKHIAAAAKLGDRRAMVPALALAQTNRLLVVKLAELDARIGAHDDQLAAIVEALRQLAEPVLPANRRRIGFNQA